MLAQLFIGAALIVGTVTIHAFGLGLILKIFVSIRAEVEARWRNISFALVVLAVFLAHVVEIWVWALFFYIFASASEIPTLEAALYFSTTSFTTVGYGDLVLTEDWRLLGSFESINGMILFGWSTAFIFELIRHVYSRDPELRS